MTTTGTSPEIVTQRAHARWTRTRAAGRAAFVWRYGVVGWGLPAGLVSVAYHLVRLHAGDPGMRWTVAAVRPLWVSIAGLLVVCGVVGYLLGAWLWDFCEARFGH